jgi:hypothetical protein
MSVLSFDMVAITLRGFMFDPFLCLFVEIKDRTAEKCSYEYINQVRKVLQASSSV